MGTRDLQKLALGFGKSDVHPFLANGGAGQQELQRHGGLTGSGLAFHQKQVSSGKSPNQDVVQPGDSGGIASVVR